MDVARTFVLDALSKLAGDECRLPLAHTQLLARRLGGSTLERTGGLSSLRSGRNVTVKARETKLAKCLRELLYTAVTLLPCQRLWIKPLKRVNPGVVRVIQVELILDP